VDNYQSFKEFLATKSIQIPIFSFSVNLILAALLGFILSRIYIKYGDSLSNRILFGKNFMMLAMTTMVIISIVKSSLALSLGLVGALSIVRFRAAIKEPEELVYLFFTIAIGLGLGADQRTITLVAFILISLILIIYKKTIGVSSENQNLYITVQSSGDAKIELDIIINIIKNNCTSLNLKRFDESEGLIDVSFLVNFNDLSQLNNAKIELQKIDKSVKITFLDNQKII